MSGVFTGSFKLMTYQQIPDGDWIYELDFGGRTCHECFAHCCNNFRLGYAKDHICGNPWTYRLHTFCLECYGDGPSMEEIPADSMFVLEKGVIQK